MKIFIKKIGLNEEEFLFIINEDKSVLEEITNLDCGTEEENSYKFITDRNLLTEEEEEEDFECQVNFLGGNNKDIHVVVEMKLFTEKNQVYFLVIQSTTPYVTGYDSFIQAEKILDNYKYTKKRS